MNETLNGYTAHSPSDHKKIYQPSRPLAGHPGLLRILAGRLLNEGYIISADSTLHHVQLTTEAIRLTQQLHTLLPEDSEAP